MKLNDFDRAGLQEGSMILALIYVNLVLVHLCHKRSVRNAFGNAFYAAEI